MIVVDFEFSRVASFQLSRLAIRTSFRKSMTSEAESGVQQLYGWICICESPLAMRLRSCMFSVLVFIKLEMRVNISHLLIPALLSQLAKNAFLGRLFVIQLKYFSANPIPGKLGKGVLSMT